MKVTVTTSQGDDHNDWRDGYEIDVETEKQAFNLSFSDGEPEDASLARDFNDVYDIPKLLQAAWLAGKNGEEFNIEEKESEE